MEPREAELVAEASGGSREAFEELVRRHQDRVYGLALRMLGDPAEAEDAAQEVFLRAYRAIRDFRGESALYTWLFKVTLNACRSRLRRLARRRAREVPIHAAAGGEEEADPPEALAASGLPGPEESAQSSETARRVREAMGRLAPEHREVVLLREIEGLSYEEVAGAVGASLAAVKSRIHRARCELARLLEDLVR